MSYRMILVADWELVKTRFSQEEKDCLNAAIVSQVICPKAGIVDLGKLEDDLIAKLDRELPEKPTPKQRAQSR